MPAAGARAPRERVDGVLLLDKPAGITSNAALQRARRALNAQKAGHTGTLDPLASGLLPLCFGEATKFASYLLDSGKRYQARIRFGVTTTTQDAEGEVVARDDRLPTLAAIEAALPAFTGRLRQVPPAYSALKFRGRALYDYAREGIDVPREARDVEIHALTIVGWASPDLDVDVACSKGTYIRTLAADLGAALGCGAHLAGLRRTQSGRFDIASAIALDALEALPPASRRERLLPPDCLVDALPPLDVDEDDGRRLKQGQPVPAPVGAAERYRAYAMPQATFLGVLRRDGDLLRPERMLS